MLVNTHHDRHLHQLPSSRHRQRPAHRIPLGHGRCLLFNGPAARAATRARLSYAVRHEGPATFTALASRAFPGHTPAYDIFRMAPRGAGLRSWGSRTSARRTGTDGSSCGGSRARRRRTPSSDRLRPRCADGCITQSPNRDAGSPASCKALQLLRGARQQRGATRVPTTGHLALARGAHAPQSERPDHLAAD